MRSAWCARWATSRRWPRDLDISENSLRRWLKQADIDEGNGPKGALTSEERKELAQLRRKVRTLEMERDFASRP